MDIQMNDRLTRIAHPDSIHAQFRHAQTGLLQHT